MTEITRGEIVRVGVDLTKHVIQIHAVDQAGRTVAAKPLPREKFLAWCTVQLPPSCLIAMEACGGAHHWARRLQAMGFDSNACPGLSASSPKPKEY